MCLDRDIPSIHRPANELRQAQNESDWRSMSRCGVLGLCGREKDDTSDLIPQRIGFFLLFGVLLLGQFRRIRRFL